MTEEKKVESRKRRYELSDASPKALLLFSVGLAATVVVTLAILWYQYGSVMGVTPTARGSDASAWSHANRSLPAIADERSELEATQTKRLQGYEWIDRETGIVRIPVERAMEIIEQEGLPRWGAANPQVKPIDLIREKADAPTTP